MSDSTETRHAALLARRRRRARRALPAAARWQRLRAIPCVGDKDVFHVCQREPAVPRRAEHREGRPIGVGWIGLHIAQIEAPVAGEVRVERDVEQPADPRRVDRRQAGYGDRVELALADRPQAAVAFRDQDLAAGQERHAPRPRDARDDFRVDFARFGLEIPRTGAERFGSHEPGRGRRRSGGRDLRGRRHERATETERGQPR